MKGFAVSVFAAVGVLTHASANPPTLPTAYCSLPSAFCPPLSVHCLLPTTYCALTTCCPPPTAYCLLPLDSPRTRLNFFYDAQPLNRPRLYAVSGGAAVGTASALLLLNQYWYANYPRSAFHIFDDSGEWLQFDKVSHALSSYYASMYASELLQWSGVKAETADFAGAAIGTGLLMTVEVLDGFSAKWGASLSDMGANIFGAGFFLTQERLFNDQPLRLKVSSWPRSYKGFDPQVQERAQELFGNTFMETLIKDYNASTVWMSLNLHSLTRLDFWPRWLNLAVGYGVQNVFGGFGNSWCDDPLISPEHCPDSLLIDYTSIPRLRQWYLSPDIDLSKLVVRKPALRFLLGVLNIIKLPAPALEYNAVDGLRFHFIYF